MAAEAARTRAAPLWPTAASAWEEFRRQPPTLARDAEAAAWLERYAASSPEQAISLALAEPHAARRRRWRDAALRGWATVASENAAAWVMRQPPGGDENADIAAVFAGAAAQPAVAFALAQRFAEFSPSHAAQQGSLLITALAETGQFNRAAEFALSAKPELREAWTTAAFSRWSEEQPQVAATAATMLEDPVLRDLAWRAAVANWAQNEAPSLADYAVRLPAGEARTYALGEALRQWIDHDTPRAARWLDQLDPSRDTDLAVSLIAMHPALAQHSPDVALTWAESITEPTARSRAVARVVKSWADIDPAAARGYARTTTALLPEDREDLLPGEHFAPHP